MQIPGDTDIHFYSYILHTSKNSGDMKVYQVIEQSIELWNVVAMEYF